MSSGGGGTNTIQQSGPPPAVLLNYQDVYNQAKQVASNPYPNYNSQLVAGFQPQQIAGFNNINTAINAATPFLNQASNYTANAAGLMDPANFAGNQQPFQDQQLASWLNTGLGDVNTAMGTSGRASGTSLTAAGMSAAAAGALNARNFGSTVGNYYNPYANAVIAPTQALFNQQNATQLNQVRGNAASQGAFGGDREAVAEAQTAQQQQLAEAPTLAGLQSAGYAQAVQNALAAAGQQQQAASQLQQTAAQQQQTAGLQSQVGAQTAGMGATQLSGFNAATGALQGDAWLNSQAGFGMGNLGNEAQSLGLQGAQAQIGAGALQQQLAQEELTVPYQQFQAAEAYPYQTTGYLEGLATGTGSLSGQQGTTTGPSPSSLSQIAGLGLTGVGVLGATGAFGAGGWLTGAGAAGAAGMTAAEAASAAAAADATWGGALAAGALAAARGGRVGPQDVVRALRGLHVPHRDDGGGVTPNPAMTAMFGGNPLNTNLYSMYQRLPTEKLQELAARSPGNSMLSRALQMRRMAPQADPAMQPQSQPGLSTAQLQASGPQSQSAPAGFAEGGDVGDPTGGFQIQNDSWTPPPIVGGDVRQEQLPPLPTAGAAPIAGLSPQMPRSPTGMQDTGEPITGAPHSIRTPDTNIESHREQVGGLGPSHSDFMSGPWGTLLAAGLGIMGGRSPYPGVNIGAGGLEGLQVAEQAKMRQAQMDSNNLYRSALIGNRQQGLDIQQERASTYGTAVNNRQDYQNQTLALRGAIADRAAQLRSQGLDQNQANAQARLDIARTNSGISQQRADQQGTYQGIRAGQTDQGLALRAQAIAQSQQASDARLALTKSGQDSTGANRDIASAAQLAASGAYKDFPTALQAVQKGRSTQPKPVQAVTPSANQPQSQETWPNLPRGAPTPEAIQFLKAHPDLAPQFKQYYGADPAQFLGQ
ncbi:MAG TPA: hypothetical protein VH024_17540 [Candidatus Angelobacter sp.]|jgi:hypothetical protein|nr:hypothetical protein [Candidatus Angelobacter sp.]